jgi:hypothetical protein
LPTCFWTRTSPAKKSSLSLIWTIPLITCNTDSCMLLNDHSAGCGLQTVWRFTFLSLILYHVISRVIRDV